LSVVVDSACMVSGRTFAATTVALGLVALAHAFLTWPLDATVALFGGGALVAFVAEAVGINAGLLEHHIGPKLAGVPLYVLFGWTGMVYVALRIAMLWVDGWRAVAIAAVLATTYDVLTDHQGVEQGHCTYTDDVPGPRFRAVPWWNFAAWLAISSLTAGLAVAVL
jgi:hypothetical protein